MLSFGQFPGQALGQDWGLRWPNEMTPDLHEMIVLVHGMESVRGSVLVSFRDRFGARIGPPNGSMR